MDPRVEIGEGTAFEVLLGAAAVADVNWREVFASGPAVYADTLAVLGEDVVRRVAALGRFGWINLVGLLTSTGRPWDTDQLVSMVRRCQPADLHYVAVGGDRRQLLALVDEPTIRDALAGDGAARGRLEVAFDAETHVLECTPWLLTSPSVEVHAAVLDLLQSWQGGLLPAAGESTLAAALHDHALAARRRLIATTSRGFLDEMIGGVRYEPAGLDRVLAVPSPGVAPVIVVVDGRRQTVILHPPLDGHPPDGAARLLELGRAVGDRTRIRVLTALRAGEMSAVDLARTLGSPRTTLLHHLAILRAAGVIQVSVTPGGATIYRLRSDGFRELSDSAAAFMPTESPTPARPTPEPPRPGSLPSAFEAYQPGNEGVD